MQYIQRYQSTMIAVLEPRISGVNADRVINRLGLSFLIEFKLMDSKGDSNLLKYDIFVKIVYNFS